MKFHPALVLVAALLLGLAPVASAQLAPDDPDWKESEAPPPPAFDFKKLLTFDAASGSSLVYGVDPASVSISRNDSLVRYVLVATSSSGARNVMYEAIHCATGEFKTYARYSSDGQWNMVARPEWRSMFDNMPSKHALRFARAGACDAAAPVTSVAVLISRLKNPLFRITE